MNDDERFGLNHISGKIDFVGTFFVLALYAEFEAVQFVAFVVGVGDFDEFTGLHVVIERKIWGTLRDIQYFIDDELFRICDLEFCSSTDIADAGTRFTVGGNIAFLANRAAFGTGCTHTAAVDISFILVLFSIRT